MGQPSNLSDVGLCGSHKLWDEGSYNPTGIHITDVVALLAATLSLTYVGATPQVLKNQMLSMGLASVSSQAVSAEEIDWSF